VTSRLKTLTMVSELNAFCSVSALPLIVLTVIDVSAARVSGPLSH
jgi:hypothetical protein